MGKLKLNIHTLDKSMFNRVAPNEILKLSKIRA